MWPTPNSQHTKRMYDTHLHILNMEIRREIVANERLVNVYKGGQCQRGLDLNKPGVRIWG